MSVSAVRLNQGHRLARAIGVCSALVLALVATTATENASAQAGGTTACQTLTVPVALTPGGAASYSVWGQLCGAAPGRVVEVLTHGITYDHTYWDWPYEPDTYSYVQAANRQGFATFNYDRIGDGNSSHPPAVSVTIPAAAYVLHQIITDLRDGRFGQSFSKVVAVGHSLGSLISMEETGTYHDVNGVVLSGISHSFATLGVALLFPDFVPTQLDPVLAPSKLPLGYITTRVGTREEHFYFPATANPNVVALDEATKQTGTAGELATIPVALPFSAFITAPVLVINGNDDQLICGGLLTCDSPLNPVNLERTFYPSAASYQQELVPETGHDLALSTTAPIFVSDVGRWISRTVA